MVIREGVIGAREGGISGGIYLTAGSQWSFEPTPPPTPKFVKGPGRSIEPELTKSIMTMESGKNETPENNLTEKSDGSKHSSDSSSSVLPEDGLDIGACSSDQQQASSGEKRKSSQPPGPDLDKKRARSSQYGTLPWYEGSWHKCMECGHVTTMGKFFASHVKAEHKMGKKEYVGKYPDDVEISEKWNCEMCGKSIAWSVRSIAAHLSRAHNMSKEDYASRSIDPVQQVDNGECDGNDSDQEVDSAQDQDILMVFDKYSVIRDGVECRESRSFNLEVSRQQKI